MPAAKSTFSTSKEYQSFRNSIALKKESVEHAGGIKTWSLYDYGPKAVRCPLVLLPYSELCIISSVRVYEIIVT
eukprot:m.136653 g.136653  ORF g.136653 m.136653 type:complete len:74 (-) comp17578_c0_seq1:1290-1511(-)